MDIVIESLKKRLADDYGNCMSAQGLSKLMNEAEIFYHAIMTMYQENCPKNKIEILIDPQKVDPEMLVKMSDDWITYIVNELGLDARDAVFVTPF